MAIFYNLSACEVLPHHPGESVSHKKAISGFFALLLRHPSTKLSHFFVYFHINAHDIEEKTMDVFKRLSL